MEEQQPEPGTLVAPAHGNGRIRRGSVKGGNRGGTGRPRAQVREAMRAGAEQAIPVLLRIIRGRKSRDYDKIAAAAVLAKYGVGSPDAWTVEEIRTKLFATIGLLEAQLPEELSARLLNELQLIWTEGRG